MKLRTIRKNTQGFTLIELMITVAIVGILAAVAMPAYQNYVIRGQVSEGITISGSLQVAIQEYYAQNGTFPANNTDLGLSMPSGKYATVNDIQNGVIVINYNGPDANANIKSVSGSSKGIALVPQDDGSGNIHWLCGVRGMPTVYAPSSCQDSVMSLL
ncbi:pilin [Paraburkholderia aromaticivorans]|uniref:pilin n=1 Tax=Paraburkholderia aromaticivorans TaxID=2026199 RepID=UPI0038B895A4